MIWRVAILLLGAVAWTSGAAAHSHPAVNFNALDGREYLYLCEAGMAADLPLDPFSDTVWRLYQCEQFILRFRQKISKIRVRGYRICIPLDAENIELVYLGMRWLDEYPHYLGNSADDVLAAALHREWPCALEDGSK